jgi:hypothetical protein
VIDESKMPIGGFFPFLSGISLWGKGIPQNGQFFDSGRSALWHILTLNTPKKVFIPYYLCSSVLDVFSKLNIAVEKYELNSSLMPICVPKLKSGEIFYLVNYFGLNRDFATDLAKQLGEKLIIDDTHDLFSDPILNSWVFRNIRKSVGLPDGAILFGPLEVELKKLQRTPFILTPGILRRFRLNQRAWNSFKESENRFETFPHLESRLIKIFTRFIDSYNITKIRSQNFHQLHNFFMSRNLLSIQPFQGTPWCYPLLLSESISRETLARHGLFIPQLWPEVSSDNQTPSWEKFLSSNLLPLPIDHRYNKSEIEKMIKIIESLI